MSDKGLMPSPDVLYASGNSLTRYRPAFTSIHVICLPENARQITVTDDGRITVFELSEEQADRLASLLSCKMEGKS